eukprot:s1149_g16.t1
MEEVRRLQQTFVAAGGSTEAFEACGRGYIGLADTALQDGAFRPAEAKEMAEQKLRPGSLLKYHCYDNRGRAQGLAVVAFDQWTSAVDLKFRAKHLAASDGYYEYWATHTVDPSRIAYHICLSFRAKCKVDAGGGPEVVHITKWRLTSPQALIGEGYASAAALEHFKEMLNAELLAAVPKAPAPPGPRPGDGGGQQSGLDAALGAPEMGDDDPDGVDALLEAAQRAKKEKARKPKDAAARSRPDFGQDLVRRVKARGEELQEEEVRRKKKKRRTEVAEDDVRRKKAQRLGDESSSESMESSDSEPVFRNASTREVDLVELSKKRPGCLLKSALKEMSRYLTARGEAVGTNPAEGKVVSYLHQVLFPQYPKAGVRAQRELMTLGSVLDLILAGELGRGCDMLIQRFKAIESEPDNTSRDERGGEGRAAGPEAAAAAAETRQIGVRRREGTSASRDATRQQAKTRGERRVSTSQGSVQGRSEGDPKVTQERGGPKSRDTPSDPSEGRGGVDSELGSGSESASLGFFEGIEEGELPLDDEGGQVEQTAVESMEAQGKVELAQFIEFCSRLEVGGKSLAQVAVMLAQVVKKCPGAVGNYAQEMLRGTAPLGTGRIRDVLPLPLDEEMIETLEQIPPEGPFKVKGGKMSGGQIKAAYRKVGVDCLSFCIVVSLNLLWGGLSSAAKLPKGPPSQQQCEVLARLRKAAAYSVDSRDGAEKGAVPRVVKEDWPKKLKEARVSYHGEVVAKAEPLELERIAASLPPIGFGGIVQLSDLCEGDTLRRLQDPAGCLLPPDEMPGIIPRPRVQVKDNSEWEALGKTLYDRGILVPVTEPVCVAGQPILNGMFGVEKTGRDLPDGRTAQRLIMDLRGSNSILQIINGDISSLSGAAAFTTIALEKNQVISIAGDDLVSSFYLFKLPADWPAYLTFERPISVLPMGFASSVGIMQHIHRRMALWNPRQGAGLLRELEIRKDREWPLLDPEVPAWALYLDDSTFLTKVEERRREALAGKPSADQERLRLAYQFWGVPYNVAKAIEGVDQCERLGAFLDGWEGRIGVTLKRLLECISLGLHVLSNQRLPRKSLQVFAGKEVHCLQMRRPLFSVYDELWQLISGPDDHPTLTVRVCEEIVISLSLGVMRFTDWRAGLDPYVMASDASEAGGGFVMAKRLSHYGLQQVLEGEPREADRSGIIVFDFFAGIGGLLRSLDRAGLRWEHHVVIESDKQCRRCIRRAWPAGSEYTDVAQLTKAMLRAEIEKVDNPRLVIAGGGSPCQGVSLLNSERQHFKDKRSGLFFNFADCLKWLEELCQELLIGFLGMMENVVMDESDRDDVTARLGWKPYLVNSSDISRARRPRFYWLSDRLPELPWIDVWHFEVAATVKLSGTVEPDALWVPNGLEWAANGPEARLPTFTRPIVRRQPPPQPAGLSTCSAEAVHRWQHDSYRYPPYTYENKHLLNSPTGQWFKVPADARELLMGFPRQHTCLLDRELFSKTTPEVEEDVRQAALGNSFHTGTVATLLGALLFQKGFLPQAKSPDQLLADLVEESREPVVQSFTDPVSDTDSAPAAVSEAGLEDEDMLQQQDAAQPDLDDLVVHGKLMSQLVGQFLRKVELRGSDIRLDSNVIYRPGVCARCSIDPRKWIWQHGRAFRWRKPAHINLLELRAALAALQWRGRRRKYHSLRTMILLDSQAVLAVLTKGRSSSKAINRILRKVPADFLMVIGKITKQQRQDERATLGKLQDLVVKEGTLKKYHEHFNRFHNWAAANEFTLHDTGDLDSVAAQFIKSLWADGFGRAEASYLLAAIQHMVPAPKHNMPLSWRLVRTWTKHELPTRAVPLNAAAAAAFAGLFWAWDEQKLAAGILVAFDFFLRTGEIFTLRCQDVEFFQHSASLQLLETKSSGHQLHSKRLLAWDRTAVLALKFLCRGLQPRDRLIPASAARFRLLWHRAVKFFELDDYYIQPYSLRRGGSTSAFRRGTPFDQLMLRGRWAHQRTARIYLDEGLQQSAILSFSSSSQRRMSWARSFLRKNGFGGTHGRRATGH